MQTSIDPEERAYPKGSLRQSQRYARALCPDGRIRRCKVGIPDTMFSIPARMSVKGKTASGWIDCSSDDGELHFYPYKTNRNGEIFKLSHERL